MELTLLLNGREVSFEPGQTILDVARANHVPIPTLCHLKKAEPIGSCRICVVELRGSETLVPSCATPATNGMDVLTESERVREMRRTVLSMLLSKGFHDCPICDQGGECLLQDLVYDFGVTDVPLPPRPTEPSPPFATPLIRHWPERCVLCYRCVTACRDLKGIRAIDIQGSGNMGQVVPIQPELCASCGECMLACPTGALTENLSRYKARPWLVTRTQTTCTYCSCGCQMELNTLDSRVVGVTNNADDHGLNTGSLCVKGRFGYEFITHPDRLTAPMVKKGGALQETTWSEALDHVARKLQETAQKSGSESVGALVSATSTNEEAYQVQKFMRTCLGTNNIDSTSNWPLHPTAKVLMQSFGLAGMTNSIQDLHQAQAIVLVGTNPDESTPIFGNHLRRAVTQHLAKLLVIDPRPNRLSKLADLHLKPQPGTEGTLLNGLMHIMVKEKWHDVNYIRVRTTGFEGLRSSLDAYTPKRVAEITKVAEGDLYKAAELYAQADPAAILFGSGLMASPQDTAAVQAAANMTLLCGNIGIPGGGLYPLRTVSNEQGIQDQGVDPEFLPGYEPVADASSRERWARVWKSSELPNANGLSAPQMLDAAQNGRLKALFVLGDNPAAAFPGGKHAAKALEQLDFLVVQDAFLTETAKQADVVLPWAVYAEKDGSFTSAERRVQRVKKAITAPGGAQSALWTIQELAHRMGQTWEVSTPEAVLHEIASASSAYAGLHLNRLAPDGLFWPCPEADHPGTPMLYEQNFPSGRGSFHPAPQPASPESPGRDYPFLVITGPAVEHDQTGTLSRHCPGLRKVTPQPQVELAPEDALQLGLNTGDSVQIISPHGQIQVQAAITPGLKSGLVYMASNRPGLDLNLLLDPNRDPGAALTHPRPYAVNVVKM